MTLKIMPTTWNTTRRRRQKSDICCRSEETLFIHCYRMDCQTNGSALRVKQAQRRDSSSVAMASILREPPPTALLPLSMTGDGKVPFQKSILSCRSLLFSISFRQPSNASFLCTLFPTNSSSMVTSPDDTNTPETGMVQLKSMKRISPTLIRFSVIWNRSPSRTTVTLQGFFPKLSLLAMLQDRHRRPILTARERPIAMPMKAEPVRISSQRQMAPLMNQSTIAISSTATFALMSSCFKMRVNYSAWWSSGTLLKFDPYNSQFTMRADGESPNSRSELTQEASCSAVCRFYCIKRMSYGPRRLRQVSMSSCRPYFFMFKFYCIVYNRKGEYIHYPHIIINRHQKSWGLDADSPQIGCSQSTYRRISFLVDLMPHTDIPLNWLRRVLIQTYLRMVRLPVKSSYPLATLLTERQQSACLMSAFLAASGMMGGTVMRVKRWLLRVRQRIAFSHPENYLSWQQQAGSDAKRSFFVLVSFSSACEPMQLSQIWRQSSRTDPPGYWFSLNSSSLGFGTSLLRSVNAILSSRASWLSLMFIWSYLHAISDFPSLPYFPYFSLSCLSGGLSRNFQRGELSQTMLVCPCAYWWLRKQRASASQLVEGWSSSMTIRWPLERELPKMASRSGWPKTQRCEAVGFSTFLKEDFINKPISFIVQGFKEIRVIS